MARIRSLALLRDIQSSTWEIPRTEATQRIKRLAQQHHIGVGSVYRILRQLKIKLPISQRRWSEQQDIELKLLARISEKPLNIRDAAKKLNRSYQVVYEHARRLGLTRRARPRWSEDKERRLETLLRNNTLTDTLQHAAEVCGVSLKHIHYRIKRMGIHRRPYVRWSGEKDKALLDLHARGVPAEIAVRELKTTYVHLARHEKRLGVTFPRTRRRG